MLEYNCCQFLLLYFDYAQVNSKWKPNYCRSCIGLIPLFRTRSRCSQPVSVRLPLAKVLRGSGWRELRVLLVSVTGTTPSSLGTGRGRAGAGATSCCSPSSHAVHPSSSHRGKDPLHPAGLWGNPVHPGHQTSVGTRHGLWVEPHRQSK